MNPTLMTLIVVTVMILAIGLVYAMIQFANTARRIETFIDHLDRELLPVIRQAEHLTRDLDEVVRNANKQMNRVENSLELLENVATDVASFKNDVLSKTNKATILGALAAFAGMIKGRDLVNRFTKRDEKSN